MMYFKSILRGTSKENKRVNFSLQTHVWLAQDPGLSAPTVSNKRSFLKRSWGTCPAQSVERATLDLGVAGSSPVLGVETTFKEPNKNNKNKSL